MDPAARSALCRKIGRALSHYHACARPAWLVELGARATAEKSEEASGCALMANEEASAMAAAAKTRKRKATGTDDEKTARAAKIDSTHGAL